MTRCTVRGLTVQAAILSTPDTTSDDVLAVAEEAEREGPNPAHHLTSVLHITVLQGFMMRDHVVLRTPLGKTRKFSSNNAYMLKYPLAETLEVLAQSEIFFPRVAGQQDQSSNKSELYDSSCHISTLPQQGTYPLHSRRVIQKEVHELFSSCVMTHGNTLVVCLVALHAHRPSSARPFLTCTELRSAPSPLSEWTEAINIQNTTQLQDHTGLQNQKSRAKKGICEAYLNKASPCRI